MNSCENNFLRIQFLFLRLFPFTETESLTLRGLLCVCASVCVCLCMCVSMFLCVCMFVYVCVYVSVNTESVRPCSFQGTGRQQPQELQDSVLTLGSLRALHLPLPSCVHPVGRTDTYCVCSAGANAAPARTEVTVHEGQAPPC